jgi:hypothetical protein
MENAEELVQKIIDALKPGLPFLQERDKRVRLTAL